MQTTHFEFEIRTFVDISFVNDNLTIININHIIITIAALTRLISRVIKADKTIKNIYKA